MSELNGMVGESPYMAEVYRMVRQVAARDVKVLILGETGTGKELVAKAIHKYSNRKDKRFVPVNCGGIPEGLLESELFGHVKGAFTDARYDKEGKFQAANGGTLLLDEIGDMNLALQVKILRVLQENEVYRVGSTVPENIDTRIIAATNKDLQREIEKGNFRQDLYYRLNIVTITIPPLRDRGDDVLLLARHFCRKYSLDGTRVELDQGAERVLKAYHWPGNVRQLESIINRAIAIYPEDLPQNGAIKLNYEYLAEIISKEPPTLQEDLFPARKYFSLEELKRQAILDALHASGYNKSVAAEMLEIDRPNLYLNMKKYGIDPRPPHRRDTPFDPSMLDSGGNDSEVQTKDKKNQDVKIPDRIKYAPYSISNIVEGLQKGRFVSLRKLMDNLQRKVMQEAYIRSHGDVQSTANILGMNPDICAILLKKYNISHRSTQT